MFIFHYGYAYCSPNLAKYFLLLSSVNFSSNPLTYKLLIFCFFLSSLLYFSIEILLSSSILPFHSSIALSSSSFVSKLTNPYPFDFETNPSPSESMLLDTLQHFTFAKLALKNYSSFLQLTWVYKRPFTSSLVSEAVFKLPSLMLDNKILSIFCLTLGYLKLVIVFVSITFNRLRVVNDSSRIFLNQISSHLYF